MPFGFTRATVRCTRSRYCFATAGIVRSKKAHTRFHESICSGESSSSSV